MKNFFKTLFLKALFITLINLSGTLAFGVDVTVDGKLGVGTTAPGAKLEVQGDIALPIGKGLISIRGTGYNYILWQGDGVNGAGDVLYLNQPNNNSIVFQTAGAERLRINNTGNLGIGTTAPTHKLHVPSGARLNEVVIGASYPGYTVTYPYETISMNPSQNLRIWSGNTENVIFMSNGSVWIRGGLTQGSSRSLKEKIQDLKANDAMDALKNLKPVRYYYKTDKENEHLGFIAEDVPELVAEAGKKSLNAMDISALAIKVIQEQQKQIDELKAENKKILARLNEMEEEGQSTFTVGMFLRKMGSFVNKILVKN